MAKHAILAMAFVFFASGCVSGPQPAGYQLIKQGMTRQEVESSLGGPPGNHSMQDDSILEYAKYSAHRRARLEETKVWVFDTCIVAVYFDGRNRVIDKSIVWYVCLNRSILCWIRALLGL
jgi:hypothetical protein